MNILAELIPTPCTLDRQIVEQDPEAAYRQSYTDLAADCDCGIEDLARADKAAQERRCDAARKAAWLRVARPMEVLFLGQDANIFAGVPGEPSAVSRYRVRYDVLGQDIAFESYSPGSPAEREKAVGLALQRIGKTTADPERRRVLLHDLRLVVGEHALLSEPWWSLHRGPFGRFQ